MESNPKFLDIQRSKKILILDFGKSQSTELELEITEGIISRQGH